MTFYTVLYVHLEKKTQHKHQLMRQQSADGQQGEKTQRMLGKKKRPEQKQL